jgi:polysaccharide deacetylase 2 family uncharacterized protein YibQ
MSLCPSLAQKTKGAAEPADVTYLNNRYNAPGAAAKPRLGFIVMHVGLTSVHEAFLSALPQKAAMALSPYALPDATWMDKARQIGFSLFVQLPWPASDAYGAQELNYFNPQALQTLLKQVPQPGGIILGACGAVPPQLFEPLASTLKGLNLTATPLWLPEPTPQMTFLEQCAARGLKGAVGDVYIAARDPNYIRERKLKEALALAEKTGYAIVCITFTTAESLKKFTQWLQDNQSRFELARPETLLFQPPPHG